MNCSDSNAAIDAVLASRKVDGIAWWLAVNHHRTHRAVPLDFKRNKFQVSILKDNSQKQSYCKSVKCGVSELLIVKVMGMVDQAQSVFWVLPDQELRNRFVGERVNPTIQEVPRYIEYRKRAARRTPTEGAAADAKSLKQLGNAAITFVSSQSKHQMREAVADWLIVDELDECDQGNLILAVDRLGFSEIRGEIRVGNPSIEGFGIDAVYKASDRKRWYIQCAHCSEWQPLDWYKNVVRAIGDDEYELRSPEYEVLCRRCAKLLDRLGDGEWVAEYPKRDESGYHISQLFSGARTIKEMFNYFQAGLIDEAAMQHFCNSVLGIGYHAKGAKLYHDLLLRIVGTHPQLHVGTDCLIGVDPGKEIHIVILDPTGTQIVAIQVLSGDTKWAQLQDVLDAFEGVAMMDCAYDTTKANEFQAANRGRVYLCDYRASKQVEYYAIDEDDMMVKVDRTQSMDKSHRMIISQKVTLPRDAAGIPGFFDQMCAPTRVPVQTKSKFGGVKHTFAWVEGSQPDHWRHAYSYANLLSDIRNDGGDLYMAALTSQKGRNRYRG